MQKISRPTDESRHSRVLFYWGVFELLKRCYPGDSLVWGGEVFQGSECSPEIFYDTRYQPAFNQVLECMLDPQKEIDRHKIIAVTQAVVIKYQPIRFAGRDVGMPAASVDDATWLLNADFAFSFGLHYLCEWNKHHYPKNFKNPRNPFNVDLFLFPIVRTVDGNNFIKEHRKWLCTRQEGPFPIFLLANLWFVLEQWGLTYARNAGGWTLEV